ncbi:HNH endonuclease [Sphingomonas sp. HDW15A]|nr:HNH endonuclease [Sphingomonas sp. HDW15A]
MKSAAAAHRDGNMKAAAELIIAANMPEVKAFTESVWGPGGKQRHAFINVIDAPPYYPVADRPKPRMPSAATRALLIRRDGFHCRFCGLPVIRASVRARFQAAYPQAVTWGTTNASQHAAFQCLWMQFDHILPNSRGGPSTMENMVVTCAPCNFGRMESTLEEGRLAHPLARDTPRKWAHFEDWDGLESFK